MTGNSHDRDDYLWGMGNSYFRCKEFNVNQEHCAMKVCTDACLFGAWVAAAVEAGRITTNRILDIGAGTGLLSLMLAQKSQALVDAVELDPAAADEAAANFLASSWAHRLRVVKADVRLVEFEHKYDLILSNPPFFENDLASADDKRNLALHSSALSLEELLSVIQHCLEDNGRFAILLPYHRKGFFTALAEANGFSVEEEVSVRQTNEHAYFRSMMLFGRSGKITRISNISIRNGAEYSTAFVHLLKDYYLNL